MIEFVLAVIFVLWLLGFIQIDFLNYSLFNINGHDIIVRELLFFLLILWLIGLLPRPFREIVSVLFVIWVLSILGILAIAGLSNIIIIAVIIGAVAYLIRR